MGAFENSIIPRLKGAKEEIFYSSYQGSAITATSWKQWRKPKNATMCMFICLGGGAGGGGGFSAASASARGGGGGGGSGALARLIIPAFFLPRTLYFLVGQGGKGGAASTIGTAGGRSIIADTPNTLGVSANTILVSGAAAAAGGTAGTSAGSRAGGAAETIATNLLSIYSGMGAWTGIAGMAGTASGALGAAGVALTFGAVGIPITGGTGGGSVTTTNTDVAGGAITGAGLVPTIAGGVAAAGAGNAGLDLEWPWIGTGGTGGGTAGAAGTAGAGGSGSCGGGGGGGGSGVTGGRGGDGGSGMIMIVTW